MNAHRYQLRISGLAEDEGRIKAATLQRVLDALLATAERTTRLLATGSGSAKGARPGWLGAAIDVTVTGLKSGSTVIEMEAPRLGETRFEAFAQPDARMKKSLLDDTALDLVARAINEVQTEDPAGDYFDGSVLEAILRFRKAARNNSSRYEMVSHGSGHEEFTLDDRVCAGIKARLLEIQAPRPFVVSGRLDNIEHGSGSFRLLVDQESRLLGRLNPESLSPETLRPLWGKQTTVEGMVHFKANGQPRLIEARRISGRLQGDEIFEEMPSAGAGKPTGTFDPVDLAGTWPGDEPLEDLLAQLD